MKNLFVLPVIICVLYCIMPVYSESLEIIDVHDHFSGWLYKGNGDGYEKAAEIIIKKMDVLQIGKMIIMPTPQTYGQENNHTITDYLPVLEKYPDRFILLGGGGTLNVMIQKAVRDGIVTAEMKQDFVDKAAELLAMGIKGFGEMTAEHLSMNPDHPYVSAPPDHPLFLLLADIAAEAGVPIDFHMEAVPEAMDLPPRLKALPNNPGIIKQNIPQFETLLQHNRKTIIIWDHTGWDNTGQWTTDLTTRLLKNHPNLYISIRVVARNIPSRPVDEENRIKEEWAVLIKTYPDRFMIGSDEFILPAEQGEHDSSGSLENTIKFLDLLDPETTAAVGYKNAMRIFNLLL